MRSVVDASTQIGFGMFWCCWVREIGEDCCGSRGSAGFCILLATSVVIVVVGLCFNAGSSIGLC